MREPRVAGASPFIAKLRHGAELTAADEAALAGLPWLERAEERGDILPEGSEPRHILLLARGWACRHKQLENGKRQITSLFLPGDLCEPFGAVPRVMDHALGALTPVVMARVPARDLREAARNSPRIEEALWWDLLMSDAIIREHAVSMGRRSATERLGHFLCEVHLRLRMAGLADGSSCEFPLTQTDLADLFGLSPVHVNRSLQELRGSGLVSLGSRQLVIRDPAGLRELSMFDPEYLSFGVRVEP